MSSRVTLTGGARDGQVLRGLLDQGYSVSCGSNEDDVLLVLDRETDAESAVSIAEQAREQAQIATRRKWKPWFPVIDYDRCTDCMQCLSFCLFDVYGADAAGHIQVQNQTNCKTDCPACSRVCPEVAILFPKYRSGALSGGDITQQDLEREAMKVDISSLLGGDIYSMLRDRRARSRSRFANERDDDRALQERQRCLKKLKEGLDIPDELLSELPSMAEIQAKAELAKEKARQAQENR